MPSQTQQKEFNSFEDFTNLYELQKTLRFELKPTKETQVMLEADGVFKKDQLIQEKYKDTKPYFDRLHREFVQEALVEAKLNNLNEYSETFLNVQKDKKSKDKTSKLRDLENKLREQIVQYFDIKAAEWANQKYADCGIKKKDIGALFEENVFGILKKKYGGEPETKKFDEVTQKEISIFDSWTGFTGYFTKFWATRKNLYKSDGTATAIATRIVDQNLRRFCENLQLYQSLVNKKIDFSEVQERLSTTLFNIFSLDYYNYCLLQDGINTYNEILGGSVTKDGQKIKGLNEIINKYRQDNKGEKTSFFKLLDKQILSEKEKFIIGIENNAQLFEVLRLFYENAEKRIEFLKRCFLNLKTESSDFDLSKVYLSREAFNSISNRWTEKTKFFEAGLFEVLKEQKMVTAKDKQEDEYNFPNFISLEDLQKTLNVLSQTEKGRFWKERYYTGLASVDEKKIIWQQFLEVFCQEFYRLQNGVDENTSGYEQYKSKFKMLLAKQDANLLVDEKIDIKNYVDNVLSTYQLAKYFALEKKRKWIDDTDFPTGDFYDHPEFGYKKHFYDEAYEEIVQSYNDIRNYLTKKPYNEDKWKLNFENSTLGNGWDRNKEPDNSAVILKKDNKFYLGLMKKGSNYIFSEKHNSEIYKVSDSDENYEKMFYKYLPDAAKMIPKGSTQLKEVQNHFAKDIKPILISGKSFIRPLQITRRVFSLNNTLYDKSTIDQITEDEKDGVKMFQKEYLRLSGDSNAYRQALKDWIEFCKDFLTQYKSTEDFDLANLRKTEDYDSLDQFYKEIDVIGYKTSFLSVSKKYIDRMNKESKLYLFEIYNQDFSNFKIGKKNTHTLYFETLFSKENEKAGFPLKLNGQAEIFFRPKTAENLLGQRTDKLGKKRISHNRYASDKLFFHCPMTLNRGGNMGRKEMIGKLNEFLASSPDINIIGIDRGEKHLAYYSVIDQRGNILNDNLGNLVQGSLNEVNRINYAKKLEVLAKNREEARRDWKDVEAIKDLKKGYISQVVHKLVDLIIKYNAIIVFEDLNMRFKQVRGGIEKSVYQQLEKALIDKLNFLVNKRETSLDKAGHLLKAYQLAAPFSTFKDMGKQTGIMFYTQASYTSKTCPQCGFRKNIGLYFESIDKAVEEIKKLKCFEFDVEKNRFKISYALSDFTKPDKNKKQANVLFDDLVKKDEFTIYTDVIRYKWYNRNSERSKTSCPGEEIIGEETEGQTKKGIVKKYNITKCIIELLKSNGIDISTKDIHLEILKKSLSPKFFESLYHYIFLLLNIRNSVSGTNIDCIQCPSCGFDSDKGFQGGEYNADANGAYNIARKGIIILDKIKNYQKNNSSLDKLWHPDLFISIDEWDKFTQK